MTNLIVEISKYLMILLMAVYTYANFRFFSFPDMERKRKVCARQNRAMFAIHFLAYLVMFLKTEDEGMQAMLLAFYGAQVVFFLCYIYLYRLLYRNVSRLLVNNACMLLCVGFIMLTRLSMAKGLDKALRQFAIVVISAVLAWLVPYIMERVWQLYKLQWVYAGCACSVPWSGCTQAWEWRHWALWPFSASPATGPTFPLRLPVSRYSRRNL